MKKFRQPLPKFAWEEAALRPTSAAPAMQGVVALIALAVSVYAFGGIVMRSIAQKKNPYKEGIFPGTGGCQRAIARAN